MRSETAQTYRDTAAKLIEFLEPGPPDDDVAGTGAPGVALVSSHQVPVLWWRFVIIGQLSPLAG